MKHAKKLGALLLMLVLVLGATAVPVQAAKKKTALNRTKVTLAEGRSVQLKLKNAPKGRKITWSSNKKQIAAVTKKGKVTAKKVGTAKITAAVSKKKYTCTVTVTAKQSATALINTEGKNVAQVQVLADIIQKQIRRGARLSTDLNNRNHYVWDAKGNLTELYWNECILKGDLSLSGLDTLITLWCYDNRLTNLDVSKNTALEGLWCSDNQIATLDLTKNIVMGSLACDDETVVTGFDRDT